MPQPPPPLTYASLVSLFASHLTVAIHTILAARDIYPEASFLTAKAYNLPIKQSRHPAVCAWINDAVAAAEAELLKGIVRRIVLVIFEGERDLSDASASGSEPRSSSSANVTDPAASGNEPGEGDGRHGGETRGGNRPFERYIWDVSRFPSVPKSEIDTPMIRQDENEQSSRQQKPTSESGNDDQEATTADKAARRHAEIERAHIDLQEQFRGLLSRLSSISHHLKPLPSGCTYTLCIELKDEADPPIGHPQPWIPVESGLQSQVSHEHDDESYPSSGRPMKKGNELGGAKTVPVRAVDAGEMLFEMWVEEGQAKADRDDSRDSRQLNLG